MIRKETVIGEINAKPDKKVIMSISKDIDLKRGICEMIDNWRINGGEKLLNISIDLDEGSQEIEYSDNAGGIPDEYLHTIIQPLESEYGALLEEHLPCRTPAPRAASEPAPHGHSPGTINLRSSASCPPLCIDTYQGLRPLRTQTRIASQYVDTQSTGVTVDVDAPSRGATRGVHLRFVFCGSAEHQLFWIYKSRNISKIQPSKSSYFYPQYFQRAWHHVIYRQNEIIPCTGNAYRNPRGKIWYPV